MQTPGTNIHWRSLSEWTDAAQILSRRRGSAATCAACAAHWAALPLTMLGAADRRALARFLTLIDVFETAHAPWGKPQRGARGGTKWESANVQARNRIWRLERGAGRGAILLGCDSKAA